MSPIKLNVFKSKSPLGLILLHKDRVKVCGGKHTWNNSSDNNETPLINQSELNTLVVLCRHAASAGITCFLIARD